VDNEFAEIFTSSAGLVIREQAFFNHGTPSKPPGGGTRLPGSRQVPERQMRGQVRLDAVERRLESIDIRRRRQVVRLRPRRIAGF
jgi:hypothetical protein